MITEVVLYYTEANDRILRTIAAVANTSFGIVSFFILYIPNSEELKIYFQARGKSNGLVANAVLEDLGMKPHLNSALRAEVLFFTTLGIRLASLTQIRRGEKLTEANLNRDEKLDQYTIENNAGSCVNPLNSPLVNQSEQSDNTPCQSQNPSLHSWFFASSNSAGFSTLPETFVFEGFSIASITHPTMRSFTCTEVIEEPENDDTTGSNITMRSSNLTTRSSRQSELCALNEQQHQHMIEDLNDQLDEALKTFGYNQHIYLALKEKKKTNSLKIYKNESKRSSVGLSLTRFADARAAIKQSILKAAQSKRTDLFENIGTFEIREYRHDTFMEIKQLCGIDATEYANSFRTITKDSFSEGASGAFVFFSSDEKYIVKTTSESELEALLDMLSSYVSHLYANPNSMLVRYLGAYCVTLYSQELYFVVMKNIFPQLDLSERYDLKGSWINRHYRDPNKGKRFIPREERVAKCPLYLDNDLQHKINLQPAVANALHNQILRDVSFLCGMDLMDYSLLVGVARKSFEVLGESEQDRRVSRIQGTINEGVEAETKRSSRISQYVIDEDSEISSNITSLKMTANEDIFLRDKDGGMNAVVVHGPATYYFGIIDILQQWNWTKKYERFFKTFFLRNDGDGLSALDPHNYCARFMSRCVEEIFENINVDRVEDFVPKRFSRHHRHSLTRESEVARSFARNVRPSSSEESSGDRDVVNDTAKGISPWRKTIEHDV